MHHHRAGAIDEADPVNYDPPHGRLPPPSEGARLRALDGIDRWARGVAWQLLCPCSAGGASPQVSCSRCVNGLVKVDTCRVPMDLAIRRFAKARESLAPFKGRT